MHVVDVTCRRCLVYQAWAAGAHRRDPFYLGRREKCFACFSLATLTGRRVHRVTVGLPGDLPRPVL